MGFLTLSFHLSKLVSDTPSARDQLGKESWNRGEDKQCRHYGKRVGGEDPRWRRGRFRIVVPLVLSPIMPIHVPFDSRFL